MGRNAAEIADSDGESDVNVAPSPPSQSLLRKGSAIPDMDLGVDFDDFLSQSQGCHMHNTQQSLSHREQTEAAEKSTGTTASLKRQIESEQRKLAEQKSSPCGPLSDIRTNPELRSSDSPIVAKTKRRRSELGTTGQMDGGREAKRKRQETYSSNSSHLRSSQSDIFVQERRDQEEGSIAEHGYSGGLEDPPDQLGDNAQSVQQQTDSIAELFQHPTSASFYQSMGKSVLHDGDAIQPQQDRGSTIHLDAFKDYVQVNSGRVSTSRSLMGNYESINLDYSGSGFALEVNANPFGDASHHSVDDHGYRIPQESLGQISRPMSAGVLNAVPSSRHWAGYTDAPFDPNQSPADEGASLKNATCAGAEKTRSRSYVDPSVLTKGPRGEARDPLNSNSSSSRKRRKTVNGPGFDVTPTSREDEIHQATVVGVDAPLPRVEMQGKKRGRKPKNQVIEPEEEAESEEPKEQHGGEKTGSGIDGLADNHPSNELHCDDDSAIGLPQEQYQPRPSRSRSKRTTEEEMPPPAHTPIKSAQTPTKQARTGYSLANAQFDEPEDTPLTRLKKEKKRKNKMKRAKTSAAALLKQSDKMLSDGEEDVVWVESKPATVKMRVPDPVKEKKEGCAKDEPTLREEGGKSRPADDPTAAGGKQEPAADDALEKAAVVLSVDTAEEREEGGGEPPDQQAPKKRGRKKKIPLENEDGVTEACHAAAKAVEEAEAETESVAENQDGSKPARSHASSARPALKERDVNTTTTTTTTTTTSSSSHHHPIDDDGATTTTSTLPNPHPNHPSTPIHPPASASASASSPGPTKPQPDDNNATDRGPTRHSPINPAGGKVKYRVGLSRRAAIPPLLKMVRK